MHVRLSTCIGTPVIDDMTEQAVGTVLSALIHPDLGTIEGFFVRIPHFLHGETLFLSSLDIVHWGTHVRINEAEAISPLEDRVRLQAFVDEGRTILGQRLMTEGGVYLGVCKDIQFNTKTFVLEWLFPRKLFRWGIAVPASAIVEVKKEAVVLREMAIGVELSEKQPVLKTLEELAKAPVSGMVKRDKKRALAGPFQRRCQGDY
jgi:uncharacterized protein YrrD